MRILVTGATGMVGSHACAALARAGHTLRILARDDAKARRVLGALGLDARALDIAPGDVTDRASVARAMGGCDALLHAAGLLTFDRDDHERMIATNVGGTRTVLEEGHARGLDPLVHVSSLSALWEPGVEVATEDSPVAAPRDPYSRSKADAERVARALQERGAPVVCVYPSAVWGPDNPTLGNQITTIFAMVQWNYYLSVEGGMPIVDARDLAQAIARAMEPGRGARRYMLAGHFLTHDEMRELVSDLRGAALWRVPCPGAALRFAGRVGDWLRRFTPIDPGAVTEESMMLATRGIRGDDAKTLSALGLALRPIRETVEAQMRWMYENGHLSARDVGRLADAARASGATPTT